MKRICVMIIYLGGLCACSRDTVLDSKPSVPPKPRLTVNSVRAEDNRKDFYQLQEKDFSDPQDFGAVRDGFLSVLANVKKPVYTDGGIKTHLPPFEDFLCPKQRFADQGRMASCSAVLIEKDQVLTSNHCIGDLENRVFVGGFYITDAERDHGVTVLSDRNICTPTGEKQLFGDIAMVEVRCHENAPMQPAPVATTIPRLNDGVYALGFPQGLPAKYTGMEPISKIGEGEYTVPLDLAGGNSGSPVFNSNHEVVGIVESDKGTDFVIDYEHRQNENDFRGEGCRNWKVQNEDSSETVHITAIPKLLKSINSQKKANESNG